MGVTLLLRPRAVAFNWKSNTREEPSNIRNIGIN